MRSRIYIILTLSALFFSFFNRAFSQIQPKAIHQIQLLLQEKVTRSPLQRKIDSRLLQALKEQQGKPMIAGVNLRPIKINADSRGNIKVDIKAVVSDALLTRIEALGGKIIYPSWQYNTIRAQVNFLMIETIAAYPEVKFITPAVRSVTVGSLDSNRIVIAPLSKQPFYQAPYLKPPKPSLAERSANVRNQLMNYLEGYKNLSARPYAGSVTSEGDRTHRADDTRNVYGYSGQGIRIGVLSDSYNALNGAPADILSGDLPGIGNPFGNTTPVTVLADNSDGEDEGRAMLQIVHDLAPKAQLFFATANISEAAFATNIQALRNAPYNCDIIIDDIFYYDEPVFQDGILAKAVNSATANGVLYFSSAGNEGSVAMNTAGYFEGDFNDSGSVPFNFAEGIKAGSIHNFGTATTPISGDMITNTGFAYTLNWADPIGGSYNDYDLFLVSSDDSVKASSTNVQSGEEDPFEQIDPLSLVDGDRLVVFKAASAEPVAFAINTIRGTLAIVTSGQTHGHSTAVGAFSVAATPAAGAFNGTSIVGPYPLVFSVNNHVESFSSDGPRRIFYNPDGSPVTPGNFLFKTNGGTIRNKPDITAADGVITTLKAGDGLNPFYGTSAAAPHAAAIAALLKSANPTLTTAQVKTLLMSTALDIGPNGYDNVSGFGIVQAFEAMQALNPVPLANIDTGTIVATEASFSNGNNTIDPGEIGKLVIQLINPTGVTATNVTGILTTTTAGVTITQDSILYGSIAGNSTVSDSAVPFRFAVHSSVPCGTTITFTLTVYFGGGSGPKTFSINVHVGAQPWLTISNKLGSTPPDPLFIFSTGFQTGRITRIQPVSSCGSQKSTPVIFSSNGIRAFDAYTFTNTSADSQCVTVTMSADNGMNMYAVAYNSEGFIPATPTINYLADQGFSSTEQTFSFTAPAGKAFTIVVHEITPANAIDSPYTLNVNLSGCTNGPACTPVIITNTFIATGDTNAVYKQSFTASGGSGSYNFSLAGNLPAGLLFSKNTLAGLPKQTGRFPITITANDITGCPSGIQNDTLIITAEIPVTYIFNGNGNWSVASNWANNIMPPATLIPGSEIKIAPSRGGECVLDIPYVLSPGSTLTVNAAKTFIVQGNITQHN